MASILIVRDSNVDRRRRAAAEAETVLAGRHAREVGSIECGPCTVVWGVARGTPIQHATVHGRLTLLVGDVVLGPEAKRLTAQDYGDAAAGPPPKACDGYHLAAVLDSDGSITLAVDILGLFPVYHTTAGDALLVTTHPGLLRAHPSFVPALDPLGLTGLLVTNGLVGGATLHRGVRRLAQGHVLMAPAGRPPVEIEHYAVPVSRAWHGLPFEECSHILNDALLEGCRRQVPSETRHTLLLSGGQDSRLLAGALVRLQVPMTALTIGEETDLDYLCARGVARHLRIPHQRLRSEPDPAGLESSLAWHGLCASPDTGGSDELAAELQRLHPRVVSGHVMDEVFAGSHLSLCYDPATRRLGFERFFDRLNGWSIPVPLLRSLLRPEVFGDALEHVIQQVRRLYEDAADTELERTYRFDMQHRERFHVGQAFSRLADGAWPCSPCIDQGVLEIVGGLPMAMLASRRLEHEVLRRHYPALAGLPLDRKSFVTTPLEPRVRDLVESAASKYGRALAGRIGIGSRERRYYHRGFNFNGAHWRSIRRAAEPVRELAYSLFDRSAFDALVPPAEEVWPDAQAPTGSAGVKLLTTLGMWLRQERTDPGWIL